MTVYLINIILTMVLASASNQKRRNIELLGYTSDNTKYFSMFILTLIWVTIYAFKGLTGTDSGNYFYAYRSIYLNHYTLTHLLSVNRDKLYQVLIFVISNLSKGSWIIGCAVIGFCLYYPVINTIKRKSTDYIFSFLMFIFLECFYFGFNGVRQGIAVSISFFAYHCGLLEKKYKKYAFYMVVAYGFHSSAILVLPFHILSLFSPKKTWVKLSILAFSIGSFFIIRHWNLLIDIFNIFGQEKMASDYANLFEYNTGSSILRFLVSLSPVLYYFFVRDNFLFEDNKEMESELLMAIFGAIFMLYSISSTSFSQMAYYFFPTVTLFLPKCIRMERYSSNRFVVLFLYFVYMMIALLNGDMHVYPYKPML